MQRSHRRLRLSPKLGEALADLAGQREIFFPATAVERLLQRNRSLVYAARRRKNIGQIAKGEALVVEGVGPLGRGHRLSRQPLGFGQFATVHVDACEHLARIGPRHRVVLVDPPRAPRQLLRLVEAAD